MKLSALRYFALSGAAGALLAGCLADFDFGASTATRPIIPLPVTGSYMPLASGKSFGTGPVHVALLLPLTGDPGLSGVGTSMANAARLAIGFVESSPTIGENITVVLKDTGATTEGAAQQAARAIAEGASLILGPLRADQVTAAGSVAKSSGIPLIGFSNDPTAAQAGVYLLSVLPEAEMRRSFAYLVANGSRGFAGIFPATDRGRMQESAFRQTAGQIGVTPRASFTFASDGEAANVVSRIVSLVRDGSVDTLFLPDPVTAPHLAGLLRSAGIGRRQVKLVGSVDWDRDLGIQRAPALAGAIYPSIDDAGYESIRSQYEARFGASPHRLATIAYTATILANVSSLSLATPRYDQRRLTAASGFNGRDGIFRFHQDGRSDYALVIKRITAGDAEQVDGPKL